MHKTKCSWIKKKYFFFLC